MKYKYWFQLPILSCETNNKASYSKQTKLFLQWQLQKENVFLEYSDFVKPKIQ